MSKGFSNFLKDLDPVLHGQFVVERYKNGTTGKHRTVSDPIFSFDKPVFKKKVNLPLASTNSRASDYLKKRKLNPTKFYYANKFKHFCNTIKPTFESSKNDHARIVIPMYDENKNLIGFQGRALDVFQKPKYLTIMLNDNSPKLYGLDTINKENPIYIVEGPFDSTLVENSVAMCGSDVDIRTLGWSNYIWVFDNEPRNRENINRIDKTIDRGDQVVIWPKHIVEKDINDMVLCGLDVHNVLESNTYKGLEAKLKLKSWKKV
tara:strand:+ start:421 stop:1206 length:786 start_codon:yes stop_codon:yes gene_type:complete